MDSETIRNDSWERSDLSLDQREALFQSRLDQALADGSIGEADFDRGKAELDAIKAEDQRLRERGQGRLTDSQVFLLGARLHDLSGSIRWNGPPREAH
jgi:hypothetical protein